MAVVVLSRPAQAWPITYTPRAHVCKTLGGSFIQRHILSRQRQAAGWTRWRVGGVLVWQTKTRCNDTWRRAGLNAQVSSEMHQRRDISRISQLMSADVRPRSETNSGWHTCRCVPPLLPHPAHQYCHNQPRKVCMPRRVISPSGRNKHYFISKFVSYQNSPKASGLPGWRCFNRSFALSANRRISIYRVNSCLCCLILKPKWGSRSAAAVFPSQNRSTLIRDAAGVWDGPGAPEPWGRKGPSGFFAEPPGSRAPLLDWNVPFVPSSLPSPSTPTLHDQPWAW